MVLPGGIEGFQRVEHAGDLRIDIGGGAQAQRAKPSPSGLAVAQLNRRFGAQLLLRA
jgi:hypothetical protein